MTEILLFNPPFAVPDGPYISIPSLAAYLRSHNRGVSAYDLNREFFYRFLDCRNILGGNRYALEQFKKLNSRSNLKFSEIVEYQKLFRILRTALAFRTQLDILRTGLTEFDYLQQQHPAFKALAIQLASAPYYPEGILQSPFLLFSLPPNPHSSSDIIQSVHTDMFFSRLLEEILTEYLSVEHPGVIGISVVFISQIVPAFCCAGIIRRMAPKTHIVLGGPSISVFFRNLKEKGIFQFVDSLVMDDGEIPLERLLEEISTGSPDLSRVPGLVYLEEGNIRFNNPVPPPEFETLPPPDYRVFQLNRYLNKREQMRVPFRLSRGCRWSRCTFCRTNLPMIKTCRQLPFELAYKNLKLVTEQTGIHKFMFADETADLRILESLSKRIVEDGLEIDWIAHTRVDKSLTRKRCLLYKSAGCSHLSLGVESFCDEILELMHKGISSALAEEVITQIDGVLPLSLYMILGFPTETEEQALFGYQKARRLKEKGLISGFEYNIFVCAYGSDIWDHPRKYGITEMQGPQGCDLMPDIYEFESHGMSRQKATEMLLFIRPPAPLSSCSGHESIEIEGENIVLNYDQSRLQAIALKQLSRNLSPSFIDILKKGDEEGITAASEI